MCEEISTRRGKQTRYEAWFKLIMSFMRTSFRLRRLQFSALATCRPISSLVQFMGKQVRSNFICSISDNRNKPKCYWAPSDLSVEPTVSTGIGQTSMYKLESYAGWDNPRRCGYLHLRGWCGSLQGSGCGRGLNMVGRALDIGKQLFLRVSECWHNAFEIGMSKKLMLQRACGTVGSSDIRQGGETTLELIQWSWNQYVLRDSN